jgi:hypothetical protein
LNTKKRTNLFIHISCQSRVQAASLAATTRPSSDVSAEIWAKCPGSALNLTRQRPLDPPRTSRITSLTQSAYLSAASEGELVRSHRIPTSSALADLELDNLGRSPRRILTGLELDFFLRTKHWIRFYYLPRFLTITTSSNLISWHGVPI